jgi:hypothetical protein
MIFVLYRQVPPVLFLHNLLDAIAMVKKIKYLLLSLIAVLGLISFEACKHLPLDIPLADNGNNNNGGGGGGGDTLELGIPCDPDTVYFENDILPLLLSNCAMSGCHDVDTHEEGIILSTYDYIMSGDEDLVTPGNANNSKLYEQLFEDGEDRMPPPPNSPLTSAEKELIYTWIEQGALNNYCEDCDTSSVTYANSIDPIMSSFCTGCHNSADPQAGIDLSNYDGVSVVAADGSLVGSVSHEAGYVPMPYGGSWLPQCQIDKIRIWVDAGYQNN